MHRHWCWSYCGSLIISISAGGYHTGDSKVTTTTTQQALHDCKDDEADGPNTGHNEETTGTNNTDDEAEEGEHDFSKKLNNCRISTQRFSDGCSVQVCFNCYFFPTVPMKEAAWKAQRTQPPHRTRKRKMNRKIKLTPLVLPLRRLPAS